MAFAAALHARAPQSPRIHFHPLALACALACTSLAAQAQQGTPAPSPTAAPAAARSSTPALRGMVVSASRSERACPNFCVNGSDFN